MTPYFEDDHLTVHIGDCREVMAAMPAASVHCVVTSPPYWGLRDYGVPGQLGLEPTPEEYVANMVAVFREVRRVLRDDGTVWLNLGDSYGAGGGAQVIQTKNASHGLDGMRGARPVGAKQLAGIPWRVAFALQADGWYLRSDIIWSKPNPMPESVTDRPTKSHEYVFLLSKSARYYFDADAVREPHNPDHLSRYGYDFWPEGTKEHNGGGRPDGASNTSGMKAPNPLGRNLRSVWTIATQPYPGAHFATFPEKLVEPCVKAGTSERGVCPECGAPWVRETKVEYIKSPVHGAGSVVGRHYETGANNFDGAGMPRLNKSVETTGWRPTCIHAAPPIAHDDRTWDPADNPLDPIPATVLDPFAGSGTTGRVANRLGRRAVLIDLSADYIDQAMLRNAQAPLGLGA